MGDMNARIEGRLDHEHHALGPHIFGREKEQIDNQHVDTHESRQFSGFLYRE